MSWPIRYGLFVVALCVPGAAHAQSATAAAGPIIDRFGAVYPIADPDLTTRIGMTYRVVFDVAGTPESPTAVNPSIATLARFLNMHAQAGVPADNMRLALVLHGSAGKDALGHEGYRARFAVDNPNRDLLADLHAAGVQIFMCGQTAAHRGLGRDELMPAVQMALSAMTALVTLQADGYHLIAF